MAAGLLIIILLIGILGMVGLFVAGYLMNRSKVDRHGGER